MLKSAPQDCTRSCTSWKEPISTARCRGVLPLVWSYIGWKQRVNALTGFRTPLGSTISLKPHRGGLIYPPACSYQLQLFSVWAGLLYYQLEQPGGHRWGPGCFWSETHPRWWSWLWHWKSHPGIWWKTWMQCVEESFLCGLSGAGMLLPWGVGKPSQFAECVLPSAMLSEGRDTNKGVIPYTYQLFISIPLLHM